MKLSEIELDFLYEKSAELFRDKVKQRGEDYEHDNRCACPEAVRFRLTSQLAVLQEIAADYQGKTIDNIIQKMGQGLTK